MARIVWITLTTFCLFLLTFIFVNNYFYSDYLANYQNKILVFANENQNVADTVNTAVADSDTLSGRISDKDGFVSLSWSAVRSIVNTILIIALLILAFSNIFRINIESYAIKKTLPNLIIGIILANASFFIILALIDVNQAAIQLFIELANSTANSGQNETNQTAITNFAGLVSYAITELMSAVFSFSAQITYGAMLLVLPLITMILIIVLIVGFIWMAFLLYIRLVVIYLLTILSPLAFLSYGIPGAEKYFKQWWSEFIKWLFMLLPISILLWLIVAISENSGPHHTTARTIIILSLFYITITYPTKIGGSIMQRASSNFMKYTGAGASIKAAQSEVSTQAKRAGSWISDKTGLMRLQEASKLKKSNYEKTDKLRRTGARERLERSGSRQVMRSYELDARQKRVENDLESSKDTNYMRALSSTAGRAIDRQLRLSLKQKNTVESDKKAFDSRREMELVLDQNPEVAEIVRQNIRSSSNSTYTSEALASQEKRLLGREAQDRLEIVKTARGIVELEAEQRAIPAELARLNQELTNLNNLNRPLDAAELLRASNLQTQIAALNHRGGIIGGLITAATDRYNDPNNARHNIPELANLTYDQLARISTSPNPNNSDEMILSAQIRRLPALFDAGIYSSTEDYAKSGSIRQIRADLSQIFNNANNGDMVEAMRGNTINLNSSLSREYLQFVSAFKAMAANESSRSQAAIMGLERIVGNWQGEIQVRMGGNDHTINAGNFQNYIDRIDAGEFSVNSDLRNVIAALGKIPGMSGSPSLLFANPGNQV